MNKLDQMSSADVFELVNELTLPKKVQRILDLISDAYHEYCEYLVVVNSLSKDSCVVRHLAK